MLITLKTVCRTILSSHGNIQKHHAGLYIFHVLSDNIFSLLRPCGWPTARWFFFFFFYFVWNSLRLIYVCTKPFETWHQVPDRGGRAYELEPPPPEMPSFQQRQQPALQRDGTLQWILNMKFDFSQFLSCFKFTLVCISCDLRCCC